MLPYQTIPSKEDGIAIVGIGGAGANILQCFSGSSADNVRLCTMSLDERVGRACGNNVEFIQLGGGLNHGLGSGGDPEVGKMAILESRAEIENLLKDVRLLVLVAGLGGGTGSGAAPVLAQMAREAGLFLVSVALMPFSFEGRRRRAQAEEALEKVSRVSDIVYCFENDYMEELFRNRQGARAVFEEVDRLLAKATASVPMLASSPGLINLGLDELATALANNDSRCIFGSGSGYGPRRAETAAQAAIDSPLVSYHDAIRYARTVIVHIAGGDSMSLTEIRQAMEVIRGALADDDVSVFFGATVKKRLGDEMRVTLIASIDAGEFKAMTAAPAPSPVRIPAQQDDESVPAPTDAGEEEETNAETPLSTPEPVGSDELSEPAESAKPAKSIEPAESVGLVEDAMEYPLPDEAAEEASALPRGNAAAAKEESFSPAPDKMHQGDLPIADLQADEPQKAAAPGKDMNARVHDLFPDDNLPLSPLQPRKRVSSDPDLEARVRNLFPEDEEDGNAPSPMPTRRTSPAPASRVNDLRDIFRN